MLRQAPLKRRTPLKRTAMPRRSGRLKRKPRAPLDQRAIEFKQIIQGRCDVCGANGLVRRHHVLTETRVRQAGGDPWARANSIWVGIEWLTCRCHGRHHDKFERIPFDRVPFTAVAFAIELLGHDEAMRFFEDHYGPARVAA